MKRIVLILLFLAGSVQADVPGRLDSLRAYMNLEAYSNTVTGSTSDTEQTSYLNRAATDIADFYKCVQAFDTIITHPDTMLLALKSNFLSPAWCVKWIGTNATTRATPKYIPLEQAPSISDAISRFEQFVAKRRAESPAELFDSAGGLPGAQPVIGKEDLPRYWVLYGTRILFYPQPADSNLIILAYYATHPKLEAVADTLVIPQRYRTELLDLAMYDWYVAHGQLQKAAKYRGVYEKFRGAIRPTE